MNVRHGRRLKQREESRREAQRRRAAIRGLGLEQQSIATRAQLKAGGWVVIDVLATGDEDTDAKIAEAARKFGLVPIDAEMAAGPTAADIDAMPRSQSQYPH